MVGNLRSSVAHRAKQKYWRKWHSSTIFDSFLFCCWDYLLWIKQMDATRERFPTANNFYMIAPEFINYCRDANTLDLPINSLSISKRIFSYLISELELRPLLFFFISKEDLDYESRSYQWRKKMREEFQMFCRLIFMIVIQAQFWMNADATCQRFLFTYLFRFDSDERDVLIRLVVVEPVQI